MINEKVQIKFFNPVFNIGLEEVRKAWLLTGNPQLLRVAVHQGSLTYRLPGTGQRISYRQLKKNLIKKEMILSIPMPVLPF